MDATGLRALQKPLKDKYREDPGSAAVPARAVAVLDGQSIGVSVDGFAGTTRAGLHPAAGGDGTEACSADMLCEAVAACAGVTLRSVATAMGVELRGASVTAEATWDARGTLGVDRSVPVGISDVTITFDFTSDADEATEAKMVSLAERYCVIAQTLQVPPKVTVRRA
ncbi:OsmC family protein [Kineococcus indalonis]|uniref:OsmC family protein n=1 Tax=Kineococcus indalonis TaxID=2696566 RepID=UPI0014134562|nr:OsmC family protein [Kineococcus indalonis]NAZ85546.1 OsmC family peroxiredoxin [Kineococcus indalonis]